MSLQSFTTYGYSCLIISEMVLLSISGVRWFQKVISLVAFNTLPWMQFCYIIFALIAHYNDVIMTTIASQITSSPLFTQPFIRAQIKKKHHSSASLAFVRGIHRGPGTSPHKWPVTRKMFPFDDVIMSFGKKRTLCDRIKLVIHISSNIYLPVVLCRTIYVFLVKH